MFQGAHPVPVSVSDARVTDGLNNRQVNLKGIQFPLDAVSRTPRGWEITKCLEQFVHCTPHISHFLFYNFSIQFQERPCTIQQTVRMSIRNIPSQHWHASTYLLSVCMNVVIANTYICTYVAYHSTIFPVCHRILVLCATAYQTVL